MMCNVFADALYWVALAHRRDQWHQAAVAAIQSLGDTRIIMTEEILVEFLNAFSSGAWLCRAAVAQVHRIRSSKHMEVIPQAPILHHMRRQGHGSQPRQSTGVGQRAVCIGQRRRAASGERMACRTQRTTAGSEVDAAVRQTVTYRPPGQ
jgi:hypothetical protein